jgi:hypothetical protein
MLDHGSTVNSCAGDDDDEVEPDSDNEESTKVDLFDGRESQSKAFKHFTYIK